jgi:hypothetical protein
MMLMVEVLGGLQGKQHRVKIAQMCVNRIKSSLRVVEQEEGKEEDEGEDSSDEPWPVDHTELLPCYELLQEVLKLHDETVYTHVTTDISRADCIEMLEMDGMVQLICTEMEQMVQSFFDRSADAAAGLVWSAPPGGGRSQLRVQLAMRLQVR